MKKMLAARIDDKILHRMKVYIYFEPGMTHELFLEKAITFYLDTHPNKHSDEKQWPSNCGC